MLVMYGWDGVCKVGIDYSNSKRICYSSWILRKVWDEREWNGRIFCKILYLVRSIWFFWEWDKRVENYFEIF